MAPALQVTHLLAFTLTDVAPSLRIVRLSHGPTLSFRIERYSLIKDVQRASRHTKSLGMVEYLSPPLVRRRLSPSAHSHSHAHTHPLTHSSSSSHPSPRPPQRRPRTSRSS